MAGRCSSVSHRISQHVDLVATTGPPNNPDASGARHTLDGNAFTRNASDATADAKHTAQSHAECAAFATIQLRGGIAKVFVLL
jgi:hypothetical protein